MSRRASKIVELVDDDKGKGKEEAVTTIKVPHVSLLPKSKVIQSQPPPTVPSARPPVSIVLNGIYRKESANLERLLNSVKGVIDGVCAIVTGTEDDSMELIRKWCLDNSIPCHVEFEPFKNFEVNRNSALKLARKNFAESTYLLTLDGDMELSVLSGFDKNSLVADAYGIAQLNGDILYPNTRLIKTNQPWKYRAVTHEFLSCQNHSVEFLNTLKIIDHDDGGFKVNKYTRDRDLLLEAYANPDTDVDLLPRYAFYLSMTFFNLAEYELSIKWSKCKINHGGFDEEVFYAKMQIGKCLENMSYLHPEDSDEKCQLESDALTYYICAWEHRPSRAEALHYAADLCRKTNKHNTAYVLACFGLSIPLSNDSLFVSPNVYQWKFIEVIAVSAYYLPAKREEGKEACKKLLSLGEKVLGKVSYDKALENANFYHIDVSQYLKLKQ